MSIIDTLVTKFNACLTVSGLREILEQIEADGAGDSVIGFYVSAYDGNPNSFFCLPVADVCTSADKELVFFTPNERTEGESDTVHFDLTASLSDEAITLRLNPEGERENV